MSSPSPLYYVHLFLNNVHVQQIAFFVYSDKSERRKDEKSKGDIDSSDEEQTDGEWYLALFLS